MSKFTICKCNVCGKKIPEVEMDHFSLVGRVGYGSRLYDGDYLELDICNDCLDNLINRCKIHPIKNDDD